MGTLQNLRNQMKELYRIHGVKIQILFKASLFIATIFTVNNTVGSVSILTNPIISIIIAVLLSALPCALSITVLGVIAIGHICNISMLAAGIGLVILALLGILSLRLAPDTQYAGIVAFVISGMGGGFSAPIIIAMTCQISALVPMLSGLFFYRVLTLIKESREMLEELSMLDGGLEFAQILAGDKYLLCIILVTAFSFIGASLIKNVEATESWKIGAIVGAVVNIAGTFLLNILLMAKLSIVSIGIWSAVGVVVALVIEYFIHNVDYKAAQTLEFEDDEYFYYVKAIPKKVKDPATKISESKIGKKTSTKSGNRSNSAKENDRNNSRASGSKATPSRAQKNKTKNNRTGKTSENANARRTR